MVSILNRARAALTRGALGLVALALAACQPVGMGGGGPSIDPNAPVPVALLVPGGSGNAGDEMLAKSLENAARLAMADLGGVRIDLRVYNTAGSPAQAQAMAIKAADEGAKIVLGPVFAAEANAAGAALAPRGINVLSFSNNTDVAGRNVFVLGPTFQNTANRLATYGAGQGKTRVMVVSDQTPAGEAGRTAILRGVANARASVVGQDSYVFSQNGITKAVPQIAAKVRASGADALFLTADTAGALPLLTQLLRDQGIDPSVAQFIGLTRWDIPAATLSLPGTQGGWFALPDPALYAQYQSRYQSAYGQAPHPISGLAYDGIAAIGALVKAGKSNALTGAALTQGSGFVGVNGIFRLRSDGTNERGLAVAQIRNNGLTIIDPAPRSFGGAGL